MNSMPIMIIRATCSAHPAVLAVCSLLSSLECCVHHMSHDNHVLCAPPRLPDLTLARTEQRTMLLHACNMTV